jgi:hypothetical protein
MPLKTEQRTRFAEELKVVPMWAWVLAGMAVVIAQIVFDIMMASDPKAPPLWGRILMAMGAGGILGCYFLMIGYINRDSGRRGMNRVVWTLVAVLVPNALGIVLYFLLRQELPGICARCGAKVQPGYNYCSNCGENMAPQCPHCQHAIHAGDVYCPFCGRELRSTAPAAGGQTTQQAELKPQA